MTREGKEESEEEEEEGESERQSFPIPLSPPPYSPPLQPLRPPPTPLTGPQHGELLHTPRAREVDVGQEQRELAVRGGHHVQVCAQVQAGCKSKLAGA